MNTLPIIIVAALLVVCILLFAMYIMRGRTIYSVNEELRSTAEALRLTQSERDSMQHEVLNLKQQLEQERSLREAEQMSRIKAETELSAERRTNAEKMRSQEEFERQLKEQFRILAGDVLGEQSRKFKEENRESMDIILKPFKDNIKDFRERVENIYSHQQEQSGALKNELQRLMELNARITTETTNLTNALKGNSKVQGDWGEVILETILENFNFIRGVHYQTQYNVKGEEGQNLRPDVVLNLPDNKRVVIDSKVSLTAYVNYVAAEDDASRQAAMAAHIASVRQHVKELSDKKYQQLVLQSPDFVIMFVPNEPAFLDAMKEDGKIWSDAYERKVIVSSPTNLFALLKIVDDLWRREDQSRNQQAILENAEKLYAQLVEFTSALEGIGSGLEQARARYDEAFKRLHTGNNNIVRLGEKLRKLGVPAKRTLPKSLTQDLDEE
ncbi:MAG: DNA recombination protein RmuC [Alistipes sp.]|nr:DNA recombination protein RmuC [Alistipes sp.]